MHVSLTSQRANNSAASDLKAKEPNAPLFGCFLGALLGWILTAVVAFALASISGSSWKVMVVGAWVVLAIAAIALIPMILPYGRRLPIFTRWLWATALVMLLVSLGLGAICTTIFSSGGFRMD